MRKPTEDYLWDKSGAPDLEVEHLERLLLPLRLQAPKPVWTPSFGPHQSANGASRWLSLTKRVWLPTALTIAMLAVVIAFLSFRFQWRSGEPWRVSALRGSPQLNDFRMRHHADFAVGQVLSTDANASARIHVANLGLVDLMPNSRLHLITTNAKRHRIALDYGTISAHMWAPPFSLAVDTPSAALFDLGCAFTLHVEPSGQGVVDVTSGWVEFETESRQVIIPAGAEDITRPDLGPGTPYFSDGRAAFKTAVAEFDSHPDNKSRRAAALQSIVAGARARDALTLLSLLNQVSRPEREMILNHLAILVPIPSGYTHEDLLDLRGDALNAYWDALHLGSPKRWLMNWRDALTY